LAGLSQYTENAIINHIFRNQAFTPPVTLHFALFTAAPSDTGGGTEVTGGSYARIAKTAASQGFSAATTGVATNSAEIDFGTASANWGTVTHFGIFDDPTAGNLLGWGALVTPKTINSSDGGKFPVGTLTLDPD
jgi:hypothetical protein